MTEQLPDIIQVAGTGDIAGNSHPIHPATVHFPISFLSLGYGLDTLFGLATHKNTSSLINSIYDVTPYLADISRASYWSNILGIVTALPAVATGVAELMAVYKKNGLYETIKRESDGKVVYQGLNPKMYHGILHAALNDVALLVSLYNWYTRKNNVAYAPTSGNIWLSALTLPGVFFSAYLGGAMVYKYGVGVQRMGEAAQIKEDMKRDEHRRFDGETSIKERKGQ